MFLGFWNVRAASGGEWREAEGGAVTGALYRTPDGAERSARAALTVVCDGMYSSLRSKLSVPSIRCTPSPFLFLWEPCVGSLSCLTPLHVALRGLIMGMLFS